MAKQSPQIEVTISYKWLFTEKEWKESIESWENYRKQMGLKIEYDSLDMFHALNSIIRAELVSYDIKKVS